MVMCWLCRFITAVSLSALILWLTNAAFNEWLNVETWRSATQGS